MDMTLPVRELRQHLARVLDDIEHRRAHVTVTRRGREAAVVVPVDEYAALEQTADILSDEPTLRAIQQGLRDLESGDVSPLEEVRRDHHARRVVAIRHRATAYGSDRR